LTHFGACECLFRRVALRERKETRRDAKTEGVDDEKSRDERNDDCSTESSAKLIRRDWHVPVRQEARRLHTDTVPRNGVFVELDIGIGGERERRQLIVAQW
jgi:hypothetical protein